MKGKPLQKEATRIYMKGGRYTPLEPSTKHM